MRMLSVVLTVSLATAAAVAGGRPYVIRGADVLREGISVITEMGASETKLGEKHDFCHGLECPDYEILKNISNKVELRRYPSYQWAASSTEELDYDAASRQNFGLLFKYISGENEPKVKIPMTAPVVNKLIVTQGPFCAANFTMHFFVPFESQENPPKPTNKNVEIVELEGMEVYARIFGGFLSEKSIQQNALALATDLKAEGLGADYDDSFILVAGYDSPFRLFDRHNEIWFVKKSK